MTYVYDIETYSNYCLIVFKQLGNNEYTIFEFDVDTSTTDLKTFLKDKPRLIGFNNLGFDAQVIEYILSYSKISGKEIYQFVQTKIIGQEFPPYYVSKLSTINIDLYKIWHFDNPAKRTSLKWLEFFFRENKIEDLPYDHTNKIDTDVRKKKIIEYCKYDVDKTHNFLKFSIEEIKQREAYVKKYNDSSFLNLPDPSIGEKLFLIDLAEHLNKSQESLKKEKTIRTKIETKDVLLPYVSFNTTEFNDLYTFFNSRVFVPDTEGNITLKGSFDYNVIHQGLEIFYGVGGIHACVKPGVYNSNNEYDIIDIDVASFYPNLGAQNNLYPKHLTLKFSELTRTYFLERKKHPKGTIENAAIKLRLNSAFGKSNSKYSFFYDPQYTVSITFNGQLLLSMLVEALSPYGDILQVNTDGLTIRAHKNFKEYIDNICRSWENLTRLTLENAYYSKMCIVDVNNYLAVYQDTEKVKRKGRFELYEDMLDNKTYNKNPSGNIIAIALNDYYTKGVDIEHTIKSCTDIYEFLYGLKKKSNFAYVLIESDSDGVIQRNTTYKDRVLRYLVTNDGGNLLKIYNDFRISQVEKGKLVTPLQRIHSRNNKIKHHDIDYDHYIEKCMEVVDILPTIYE